MNKLLTALAILLAFSGCTDSEQQEARDRQARREAEMQRLEELERRAHPPGSTHEEVEPEPETPAAPPEPEYREETTYFFTSLTEKTAVECDNEPEQSGCGVSFTGCSGGSEYYCQTNVKIVTKTKRVLVTE